MRVAYIRRNMKAQYTPIRIHTALTWEDLSLREREAQEMEPRTEALPIHGGVYLEISDDAMLFAAASRAYASAKRFKQMWDDTEVEEGFWVYDPAKGDTNEET
jgi:hypothetical protein